MGGHASFLKPKQTEWIKRWVLILLKGCKADCRIFRLIRNMSSSMYFEPPPGQNLSTTRPASCILKSCL